MLAWRWWKNRQGSNRPTTYQDTAFTDSSTRSADTL
jgi:hypothetical protein